MYDEEDFYATSSNKHIHIFLNLKHNKIWFILFDLVFNQGDAIYVYLLMEMVICVPSTTTPAA